MMIFILAVGLVCISVHTSDTTASWTRASPRTTPTTRVQATGMSLLHWSSGTHWAEPRDTT
jgi:hypothetical protein